MADWNEKDTKYRFNPRGEQTLCKRESLWEVDALRLNCKYVCLDRKKIYKKMKDENEINICKNIWYTSVANI